MAYSCPGCGQTDEEKKDCCGITENDTTEKKENEEDLFEEEFENE